LVAGPRNQFSKLLQWTSLDFSYAASFRRVNDAVIGRL
jgi:hypothetical protein